MATHLSPKENYMRMMNGEIPEYVPNMMAFSCGVGPAQVSIFPDPGATEFIDLFGVPMIVESNSGPIPKPGQFILEDVTKWRDIIKRPSVLDEIDWEMCAKKDLDNRDPELLKFVWGNLGNGYFMNLTYYMGFNNALIACIEEPEEVKALLSFLLELNLELGKNYIKYYKPDIYHMGDDIAHERAPFVSEETFLDIFAPMWRENVKLYKEAGIAAEHHNCGAFEAFVPHIVDMGFNSWNPAQPRFNDLPGIKKKFGRKLAICGGLENQRPDATEEELRSEVRRTMDELAPGGGYAFGGIVLGNMMDPEIQKRNGWIMDEYEKNKFKYYN